MLAIPEISDVDLEYGNIKWLPKKDEIPITYWNNRTKWHELYADYAYKGVKNLKITPKAGLDSSDVKKAWRAIRAVAALGRHDFAYKEAAVAYACSQWFDDVSWDPVEFIFQ